MSNSKCLGDYSPLRDKWDQEKGTQYSRIYRHLNYFIKRISESHDADSITEAQLLARVELETGFKIRKQTFRNYLEGLQKKYGECPLEPFFKINLEFFRNHTPKPPKQYQTKSGERI